MPRIGAEAARRRSLIDAAILTIGEQGSLDVSVREIASRAGMSTALAFHYFGGKDEILLATMRHLLREFAQEVRSGLVRAARPYDRIAAIVRASFAPSQFDRRTISAWLVFYLHAHSSQEARRLLHVYARRLHSNLMDALRRMLSGNDAAATAEGLAALIDGLYVRHSLRRDGPDSGEAVAICMQYLDDRLQRGARRK
jgi:TetR/AcrR family transcriptional regulator, transcriptional repressor of bet genes